MSGFASLLALAFGWDTHFNKFGPDNEAMALWKKIAATLGAQLIFWSLIWTPVVGGLAGLLFHLITRKSAGNSAATNRTQPAS